MKNSLAIWVLISFGWTISPSSSSSSSSKSTWSRRCPRLSHDHYCQSIGCLWAPSNMSWSLRRPESFWTSLEKVMFIETSGRHYLLPRQVCSIESACRNSDLIVLVLMLSDGIDLSQGSMANLWRMGSCSNKVYVRRLDPADLVAQAGLQWSSQGVFGHIERSGSRIAHLSDLSRLLLLYLYGGWYSDIDVIVLKSLAAMALKYSEAEVLFSTDQYFPNSFSSPFDKLGHRCLGASVSNGLMFARIPKLNFFKRVLDEFEMKYSPDMWTSGGANLLTSIVIRQCKLISNTDDPRQPLLLTVESVSVRNCGNLQLLHPRSSFYPLSWMESQTWWQPGMSVREWQDFLKDATTMDLFSSSTRSHENRVVEAKYYGAAMPALVAIAPTHCPLAFNHMLHRPSNYTN